MNSISAAPVPVMLIMPLVSPAATFVLVLLAAVMVAFCWLPSL
ncbi:MAG: hypothetical protein ACRD2F_08960 [Terriglobales bacterium]